MSRQLEDRLELAELATRFAHHLANMEIESWVETFTPEGVLDQDEFGKGVYAGHDNIRARGQQIVEDTESMVVIRGSEIIWHLEDQFASGSASALIESVSRSGQRTRVYVVYEDEFVRTEQGWRIGRTVLRETLPAETVAMTEIEKEL
jgi:hypothetical protein